MTPGPRWARARIRAIEEELGRKGLDPALADLLRNGYIPKGSEAEARALELAADASIPDGPPTFPELARYSTYFALNPGHVAGEERPRNSKSFPVGIKASQEDVERMLEDYIDKIKSEMKDTEKMIREANAMAARLRAGRKAHPLAGLHGLEGLGRLDNQTEELIRRNRANIEAGLGRLPQGNKEVLDFKTVVETYNQGITREEIEAWVWFKRSLGTPMTGWEDYFLRGGGDTTRAVTLRQAAMRDIEGAFLRTAGAGQSAGRPTGRRRHFDGKPHLVLRDEEGLKLMPEDALDVRFLNGGDADPAELSRLVRAGALCYLEGELLPVPVYAYANMYDRLQSLEGDRAELTARHGEEAYTRQKALLERHMPPRLSVNHPDPAERPKITFISDFTKTFMVKTLRESTGVVLNEAENLRGAFDRWLNVLDPSFFKASSATLVKDHYCNGKPVRDTSLTEEERRQLKADARNEGEAAFELFLHEALLFEDQRRLDLEWNRLYNGHSVLPYDRIPVGFRASSMFKRFPLEIRPAQREGIAFMNAVGSGIIAYDVGVGKTLTAIVTMADAIFSGKARRPLVVVPNPTYHKWVAEIAGFTDRDGSHVPGILSRTGVRVNGLHNLGGGADAGIDLGKAVPEGSITVVTYEGFKRIGFSAALREEMLAELAAVLEQQEDGVFKKEKKKKKEKTAREKEKEKKSYEEMLGAGVKETVADIDTLGFDMIVIDEAHRCKNIFDKVDAKDGRRNFSLEGAVSETGVKAFFLCNYIQRRFGRNVMLLTATPFTNSPLEIYSMLSLVAYDAMKRMGILNIHKFFELFVQETMEMTVNHKEEIVARSVVKRFSNRLILQRLIHNHINYKTGEEAGVARPCKLNLPRVNEFRDGRMNRLNASEQALTYLRMTERQREQQVEIIASASKLTEDGRPDMGAIFRAMSMSLDNALSPFLIEWGKPPRDCVEFVEGSPKIHYACGCIQSVRDWHVERGQRVSGQVIYMNRGKRFFPLLKEYLEKKAGFAKGLKHERKTFDEVEVITSEMSMTRKEDVKEAFLEGVVKVIIGTATIREGIDLQKNSTVLYNLYPEWNPTDIRQLEGRIWRQGNRFGYVRVVMPLVQDSMDVFVFQKLEEKTHRINDIWYRGERGNVLDLESLDPEDVKFALMSDVRIIAESRKKMLVKAAENQRSILASQASMLNSLEADVEKLNQYRADAKKVLDRLYEESAKNPWATNPPTDVMMMTMPNYKREDLRIFLDKWEALGEYRAATPPADTLALRALYMVGRSTGAFSQLRWDYSDKLSTAKRIEGAILKPLGMNIERFDIEALKASVNGRIAELDGNLAEYDSEAYMGRLLAEANYRKSALAVEGKEVADRVVEFKRYNHLLGYLAGGTPPGTCRVPEQEDEDEEEMLMVAEAMAMRLRLAKARMAS